jgi:hypothetical protein
MFNNATIPYSVPVTPAGTNGNGGFFGGDSWAWIIVLLLIFGWGGNGFGGFGGGGGNGEVQRGFDHQSIVSKLDQQTYGLADSTYALNNAITNGFHGVDNAICNLGYNMQQGFNGLGHQISDCCCATQRAIDGVNYNMATQACDTRHAIQDSTRQILDFLTTDKIATLQAENQNLKLKASQAEQNAFITANQSAQTAELIRRLGADCPTPAYVVQPPQPVTFPVNGCGQFNGYGYNGGGCGCGC